MGFFTDDPYDGAFLIEDPAKDKKTGLRLEQFRFGQEAVYFPPQKYHRMLREIDPGARGQNYLWQGGKIRVPGDGEESKCGACKRADTGEMPAVMKTPAFLYAGRVGLAPKPVSEETENRPLSPLPRGFCG